MNSLFVSVNSRWPFYFDQHVKNKNVLFGFDHRGTFFSLVSIKALIYSPVEYLFLNHLDGLCCFVSDKSTFSISPCCLSPRWIFEEKISDAVRAFVQLTFYLLLSSRWILHSLFRSHIEALHFWPVLIIALKILLLLTVAFEFFFTSFDHLVEFSSLYSDQSVSALNFLTCFKYRVECFTCFDQSLAPAFCTDQVVARAHIF